MSLTITKRTRRVVGDAFEIVSSVDFDSSYPVGGESLTPSDLGLSDRVGSNDFLVRAAGRLGYTFEYDYTNSKIKVLTPIKKYSATVDIASGGTDTATSTVVTVSGVLSTDLCIACQPVATLEAGQVVQSARVTGADQITVEATNASSGTVNPGSATFDFYVVAANGAAQEIVDTTSLAALTGVLIVATGKFRK